MSSWLLPLGVGLLIGCILGGLCTFVFMCVVVAGRDDN